ncbi:diguanylate cyclase [Photobacterium aquae]|uniref:Diguanylate cyclase n=1 Tax=Photobacterium aquae TaxID=1195763 RepID=A0A0J1GX37_9GAMM|nr:PAS domain-containing protein [Photobacterium aquae]KLV04228.1 diguanylate cyclase [Photobacterium aquae]
MLSLPAEFEQFHWMVDMVQHVDMGLIVLDREYTIHVWNGFMTHHSGKQSHEVLGKCFFDVFPEVPRPWFEAKSKPVFNLGCRSFLIWRQRPYLFKCRNVRPITQQAPFMYQNVTLNPMTSPRGDVEYMFLSVDDVTSEAMLELHKG